MAISFLGSAYLNETVGTSSSDSVPVPATTNGLLLLGVEGDITVDRITGATYNGIALTLLAKGKDLADRWNYLFALPNPPAGTFNLVINASASTVIGRVIALYEGVRQTGLPDAAAYNSRTGTGTLTGTVTTTADNCWLVCYGKSSSGNPSAGANTTQRESFNGFGLFDSNGPKTPAGSHSLNLSVNTDGGICVAAIAPAVTGTSSSVSPSVSPSASQSPSASASRSVSPSASLSPSASASRSVSPSASLSPSASASRSVSPSASQSPSASTSPSVSPSASLSPSASASASVSPSASTSPSSSASASVSPSASQSPSASTSPSSSASASTSPSASLSPSASGSASVSPSASEIGRAHV